jgi:hypothetical protein
MAPFICDIPPQSSIEIKQDNIEHNISTTISLDNEYKNSCQFMWFIDDYYLTKKSNQSETFLHLSEANETNNFFMIAESNFYSDNYDVSAKFEPTKIISKKVKIRSVKKFVPKPVI